MPGPFAEGRRRKHFPAQQLGKGMRPLEKTLGVRLPDGTFSVFSLLPHPQLCFLRASDLGLTSQLVRDNADLRCELPKLEKAT